MDISFSGFSAYVAIILFVCLLTVVPIYIISKLRRRSYEFIRRYNTIVTTEFEAPMNLTPAELGYIVDAKFSKREFYATVLDLEQRGYITIEKELFRIFSLHKTDKSTDDLKWHELVVATKFTDTFPISTRNLDNWKLFRQAVLSALTMKGLVKSEQREGSYLVLRIIVIFLILITVIPLAVLIFGGGTGTESIGNKLFFLYLSPILFVPFVLPVSIMLGYVYHTIVGETNLWTKKTKQAWAEVSGYSDFIKQVELDNIQFGSSELKNRTKIKALPYAVALGMNTKWEERFD